MTADTPMVWLLLVVAVAVAIVFVLAGLGVLRAGMEPPHDPWWSGRRRRRAQAELSGAGEETVAPSGSVRAEDTTNA